MIIQRYENTIYPNTEQGKQMADEYESKLRDQGIFQWRIADDSEIIIRSYYKFNVEVDND